MPSLDSLLLQRRQQQNVVNRAQTAINKHISLTQVLTLGNVQVYIKSLSDASSAMSIIHEKIMEIVEKEDYVIHEKVLDTFCDLYFDVMGKFKDVEMNLCPIPSSFNGSSAEKSFEEKSSTVKVKLAALDLPIFDGNYLNWSSFKDLFMAAVDSKTIPPSQKLQYLISSLTGEAKDMLCNIKIDDNNYKIAIDLLCKRYENKRKIAHANLSKLFSQPAVDSSHTFRKFVDVINSCINGFNAIVSDKASQRDALLIHLLAEKMDSKSKEEWIFELEDNDLVSFEKFSAFINRRASALEEISFSSFSLSQGTKVSANSTNHKFNARLKNKGKPAQISSFVAGQEPNYKCSLCKVSDHTLFKCPAFNAYSVQERKKFTNDNQLCHNCLYGSHLAKDCQSRYTCRHCQKKHNSLLHDSSNRQPKASSATNLNNSNQQQSASTIISSKFAYHASSYLDKNIAVLNSALVYLHDSNNAKVPCRILIDNGSKVFIVGERCVNQLGIKRKPEHSPILGIGNCQAGRSKGTCTLTLSSRHHDFSTTFESYILPEVTGKEPSHQFNSIQWPDIKSLPLADPNYNVPSEIDLIVNAAFFNQILLQGRIEDPKGCCALQNTKLGWIFSGKVSVSPNVCAYTNSNVPTKDSTSINSTVSSHLTSLNARVDLNDTLKRFWELEELPESSINPSQIDVMVQDHFDNTHIRDETGRFIVKLPFQSQFALMSHPPQVSAMGETGQEGLASMSPSNNNLNPLVLGFSRPSAVTMLHAQEKRFKKNPELKRQYVEFMREYLTMGHMEQIRSSQVFTPPQDHYYIPHHAVLKPSSTTTKLRVVFNASKKTTTGKALNDILCVGPNNQEELFQLFIQFRVYVVAVIGDIEKYYRQPRVFRPHTDFQRIVWREEESQPVGDYRLLTPTYGTAPAAFLTNACRRQLAISGSKRYPLGAKVVLNRFYVDDMTAGAKSITEAIQMTKQVISLLNEGGFPLRKIASSHQEVLIDIPSELCTTQGPQTLLQDDVIKTLGILWHPKEDVFTFSITLPDPNQIATKRIILSTIARIFDFGGWISPVTIIGKIIMQSIWKEMEKDKNWDSIVPVSIQQQWTTYCTQLPSLSEIKINRCLVSSSAIKFQLHGFSDASMQAYAAVIYLRSEGPDGISVNMVAAKTRVSPIKATTIPRLELCGALLLTRLMKSVKESMDLDIGEIHCWTDSTVTFHWINGSPDRWKQFVANRVASIQQESTFKWHHVPGEENPADCASRGITPTQLKHHSLWWHGPKWLENQKINFSSHLPTLPDAEMEIKNSSVCNLVRIEDTLLSRYSKLSRLLFITACCRRFIFNCRHKDNKKDGDIDSIDTDQALRHWIRIIQEFSFHKEIKALRKNKLVNIKSPLSGLSPFLDASSIIRVGGRLKNLNQSEESRHPILLPHKNFLTILIVRALHESNLHASARLLLATIRQKYWIIRGLDVVKSCIKNCVKCIRFNAQAPQPMMGHLPAARVNPSEVFLHTGVDYAGPVELRGRNGRGHFCHKGYIAVFVCLATKAVHLELVSDCSTPAFIATLRRFIGRRGLCAHIYSDKGSNFIGANHEFRRAIVEIQSKTHDTIIGRILEKQGVIWHFNPPASPHMGGLWEAAVKSTKTFLRKFEVKESFTFEEMTTILCQIEACLNSRPLCALSSDPNDMEALTPGHFLIGRPLNAIPDPSSELRLLRKNNIQRWVDVQHQVNLFWNRWSDEYVSEMQKRVKWRTSSQNIKVDDKVIIQSQLPPAQWRLGKVVKVHPGPDGIVRSVTVWTNGNTNRLSVMNLCLLPAED